MCVRTDLGKAVSSPFVAVIFMEISAVDFLKSSSLLS